jgi:hypothetical protein
LAKFNLEKITDIINLTRNLMVGLRQLTFEDNFESFEEVDLVIPATSEARIRNQLNFIPSKYIITMQTGAGQVTKGTTEWNTNYIYLYNNGASSITITVRFLK